MNHIISMKYVLIADGTRVGGGIERVQDGAARPRELGRLHLLGAGQRSAGDRRSRRRRQQAAQRRSHRAYPLIWRQRQNYQGLGRHHRRLSLQLGKWCLLWWMLWSCAGNFLSAYIINSHTGGVLNCSKMKDYILWMKEGVIRALFRATTVCRYLLHLIDWRLFKSQPH